MSVSWKSFPTVFSFFGVVCFFATMTVKCWQCTHTKDEEVRYSTSADFQQHSLQGALPQWFYSLHHLSDYVIKVSSEDFSARELRGATAVAPMMPIVAASACLAYELRADDTLAAIEQTGSFSVPSLACLHRACNLFGAKNTTATNLFQVVRHALNVRVLLSFSLDPS